MNLLTRLLVPFLIPVAAFSQCTDLFFSEYLEGTSNNKAIEVYNPTSSPIDLSNYKMYRANNGAVTPGDSLLMTGMLAPGDVYVAGNPSAVAAILSVSDTLHTITFFNGDDAMWLVNIITGDTLDIIGIIGNDPGTNWPVGAGATSEYTLVRDPSIQQGQLDWSISATEWLVLPQNTVDSLGMHSMTSCGGGSVVGPCLGLFISEYLEGSSNNKAFEIFNPTPLPVSLADYVIYRSNSAAAIPSDSLLATDTIAPGDVYVVANPSAVAGILAVADTTHTTTFFNGDDAIWVKHKLSGDTLDIIGTIDGNDPGTNWVVGAGATSEYTLVRNPGIHQGQTDWTIGATEWLVLPQNTVDSLGAHTMTPCGVVLDPTVSFSTTTQTVDESVGNVTVTLSILNSNANPTSVDVSVAGGSALNGTDYTFTSPTTVTFPGGSGAPQIVTISVVDDLLLESTETIILRLSNATNNASIGPDSLAQVNIDDNDTPIPVYPIAIVTTEDGAGVADSAGVECELRGVVIGGNLSPTGLTFTLHDGTGGINVFSFTPVSGYSVTEGDSVHVRGTVTQFNGLTETIPDSIMLVSQGNAIPAVQLVTQLDESTESELVKLVGFWFADTTQWTTGSGNGGFNVDITNGVDTFDVRIDLNVNLYNMPRPTGSLLNFTGLGNQYDPSSPYTTGYELFPRSDLDIEQTQVPGAAFSFTSSGQDFDFTDLSTNWPTAWLWEFGDGNTATTQNASHSYASPGTYIVCLTASNPAGSDSTCQTAVIAGIAQLGSVFTISPNPAGDWLRIEGDQNIKQVVILDARGAVCMVIKGGEKRVPIAHLAAGSYILSVQTKEGILKRKFVKE